MTIEQLAEAPLILYDARWGAEDPTRRQLRERAQRAGVTIEPVIEVEYLTAALDLAARGLGDTIARPRRSLDGRGFARRLHRVAFDPPMYDTFAFITRRNAHLSPATRAFMELGGAPRTRRWAGRALGYGPDAWQDATVAEEEYLQTIFWLQEAGLPMTGANIARAMQLSAPTVHEMVGRLERDGYITRGADKSISFTADGREHAEAVVRRHRLIERFLTDVLGIPWDDVHEEAERLEHAMSPVLESRMLAAIGDAKTCPHGHPIEPATDVVLDALQFRRCGRRPDARTWRRSRRPQARSDHGRRNGALGNPDEDRSQSRRRQLSRASKSLAASRDADHDRQRPHGPRRCRRRKHWTIADVGHDAAVPPEGGGSRSSSLPGVRVIKITYSGTGGT